MQDKERKRKTVEHEEANKICNLINKAGVNKHVLRYFSRLKQQSYIRIFCQLAELNIVHAPS
jgi:hypothetical protein